MCKSHNKRTITLRFALLRCISNDYIHRCVDMRNYAEMKTDDEYLFQVSERNRSSTFGEWNLWDRMMPSTIYSCAIGIFLRDGLPPWDHATGIWHPQTCLSTSIDFQANKICRGAKVVKTHDWPFLRPFSFKPCA